MFNEFIYVEQLLEGYVSEAICLILNMADIKELEDKDNG